MYSIVSTGAVCGVGSLLIQVEADVCDGMPTFEMVGALSSEVKEAKERIKAAIRNSGIRLAPKKVTVNLYPADVRKAGTGFDLPIALAVLAAYGRVPQACLDGILFAGEVSLHGEILPAAGILPMVLAAKEAGKEAVCVPRANLAEAQVVKGIKILPADSLTDAIAQVEGFRKEPKGVGAEEPVGYPGGAAAPPECDFADIRGQKALKRACEVAAAGRHNMLMLGAPGSGKTMAAKAIAGILPPLAEEEALELAKIYSVSGMFGQREAGRFWTRPFRSPHHTVTAAGLAGGGLVPKPGEISLAHKGVLFLDELTEFQKPVLEILRQPLEERSIRLVRSSGTYSYPADVMLVAAMNPCSCGYFPDRDKCTCSLPVIERHLKKASRPFLDRMDLCVEVQRLPLRELAKREPGENSASIRERVGKALGIQRGRFAREGILYNSQIPNAAMERYCPMEPQAEKLLQDSFERLGLTVRGYYRVIRVARTIADLDGSAQIRRLHVMEALLYRGIDRKMWGLP